MNRDESEVEVAALARALERGIPEGPAAIHFCPWPGCDDLWESEASCVHALALAVRDRVVAANAAETALRDAAAALAGYEHYDGALLVGDHRAGFLAGWNLMWHEAQAALARAAAAHPAEGNQP